MADHDDQLEAAIDDLYGLPLDDFTTARDELARGLRREGRRDAAEHVKRLRKPSVSAWALNQVRRNDREQSNELIEVGQRLREGHERLLEGAGRGPLQEAIADERRLVGELARHAERELAAAGRSLSGTVQERLRATLHAVASDAEAREGLAAGRLVRDHEASGLGPLIEAGAGQVRRRDDRRRKESPARASAALERKARRLAERLERARASQRELAGERAEATRRLRDARRSAARAAAELERAEAAEERAWTRAEEAADSVTELERELDELTAAKADGDR